MRIDLEQLGQVTCVAVSGSIDAFNAEQFENGLEALLAAGHTRLVLDLSEVDFMGSDGLRAILAVLRKSRRSGGDLCVAAIQLGVARVLEMSGATRILRVYPDRQAALASLEPGPPL